MERPQPGHWECWIGTNKKAENKLYQFCQQADVDVAAWTKTRIKLFTKRKLNKQEQETLKPEQRRKTDSTCNT